MKKKIPLLLLERFQPIVDSNSTIIKVIPSDGSLYHIVDSDLKSKYYFKVVKQERRADGMFFHIEFFPKDDESVSAHGLFVKIDTASSFLSNWIEIIKRYDKISTIYDDPILKANADRFEEQFNIIDENADYVSFNLQQQLFLDNYLEQVKKALKVLQDGKSEAEITEFQTIEKEAIEIQENLTKESKRKVIQRLSKLWARSQKLGLVVLKEIFIKASAEIVAKLVTQ